MKGGLGLGTVGDKRRNNDIKTENPRTVYLPQCTICWKTLAEESELYYELQVGVTTKYSCQVKERHE